MASFPVAARAERPRVPAGIDACSALTTSLLCRPRRDLTGEGVEIRDTMHRCRMDDGYIVVETDDGMYDGGLWVEDPRTTLTSTVTVNDGVPHCILVQRVDEMLSITIDGLLVGEATSISSFAALAPLAIGTDTCDCAGPSCVPPQAALLEPVAALCVEGAERPDE